MNETAEKTRAFTASELFDYVWNYLDGAGICCTDANLLAEEIGDSFGVPPEDVYEHYDDGEED